MTSTSFNVGLNSSTRNSSKVLKPPGGGSSDIFGSSGEPNEPQRKVKNHLTSSIFTSEDTVTPSRNKAGNDSFYNLFGSEPHRPVSSACKTQSKSNITLSDESSPKSNVTSAKKSLEFVEDDTLTNTESSTNGVSPEIAPSNANGSFSDCFHETPPPRSSKQIVDLASDVATSTPDTQVSADSAVNGASSSTNSSASTPAPTPSAPAPPPTTGNSGKQRVPPGGFSSGLW